MATTTTRDIVYDFLQENGKNRKFRVDDYRPDLTDAEIKAGGQGIVDDDIFVYEGFGLTAFSAAQREETTVIDVDLS